MSQNEQDDQYDWPGFLVVAMIVLGMVGCAVSNDWRAVELARIKAHETAK